MHNGLLDWILSIYLLLLVLISAAIIQELSLLVRVRYAIFIIVLRHWMLGLEIVFGKQNHFNSLVGNNYYFWCTYVMYHIYFVFAIFSPEQYWISGKNALWMIWNWGHFLYQFCIQQGRKGYFVSFCIEGNYWMKFLNNKCENKAQKTSILLNFNWSKLQVIVIKSFAS